MVGKDKGKGKANAKTTKHFLGYCLVGKAWGHAMKDCWWNEGAKSEKDTASLETPTTPAENTKTQPSITWMLIQSDESEFVPANLCTVVLFCNETRTGFFLIVSGAVTSLCIQSLGGKLRGPGVELKSATGHQFTTICLRTRDGVATSSCSAAQVERYSTSLLATALSLNVSVSAESRHDGEDEV